MSHASLSDELEVIRAKHQLPAIQAMLFTTEGVVETAAVGVRKQGDLTPITEHDLWHIGSDAKVMTAMLVGTFVAEGKLNWNDPIISFFPEWKNEVNPALAAVTVSDLLSHRSGLIENLKWRELAKAGSLMEQRLKAARLLLTQAPAYPVGEYHYANTNYVLAGAILEKLTGRSWEYLMTDRVFRPLKITTAGFGGSGTPGQVDQPWAHDASGRPAPLNGPAMDNPLIMAPAGGIHLTAKDWAKFLIDQLRGANGLPSAFPQALYVAVQSPHPNEKADYGYGWIITPRPWAGGNALTHGGSNTLNYAVCWLAPKRQFGILVCTNQGGDSASKACDDASVLMFERYAKRGVN